MVLRILMRYLANNEQLVQKLSESYPVRRAAQLIVAGFYKTKHVVNTNKIADLSPEKFRDLVNSFKQNLKSEIEDAKQELKRRNKPN